MNDKNNQESGINAFLEAVNYLFHSSDKNLKVQANKFLVAFESKPESWDISYQVLLKDDLPDEAYYNALNILKNKIKYDFASYSENPQYIEKLLSFFLNNIDKFKKMKHYILINYCDCIGKAFLFTEDKFNEILKKFTNKLYGQNADIESLLSLLLIFNFICEAKFEKKMVIDDRSRQIFSDNIKNISNDVFQFLIFMINKLHSIEDNNLKHFISDEILETINNYLYIDFDDNVIFKFNNEYLPIINFIFQIDEENLDKHAESICSLFNLPLQENNMQNLSQIIFSKILGFKDILYKSFDSIDDEQASFYIDIFSSMIGNNFEELIVENRFDFFQIIIDLTKKCPSNKIGSIVDFFNYLSDYLLDSKDRFAEKINNFKNLFGQLVLNFIGLTKFEDETFSKLNIKKTKALKDDDEYNITLDFREAAKDILVNYKELYGFNSIFNEILFPEFKKVVLKIKENQQNINNWSKMENLLFIFSCICKYAKKDDSSFDNVEILFHTMFDIPKEYVQIIRTVSDIIDNCSCLLSKDKDLLFKGFKYLINGLDSDLVMKYCSVSAKNLLKDNREIMFELREDLLALYEKKLKNKILENDRYLYIVEGIVYAVTFSKKENEDYDKIKSSIVEIMKTWVLYIQEAKKILEQNNNLSPEQNDNVNELLIILKSISLSAFESLLESQKSIMNEILIELYPIILYILEKMPNDKSIVENCIQLIKVYMRGLVNSFIKFIPEYVNCIINGYKLFPISSYIYGFEILVSVFPRRKEEELRKILKDTFNKICNITFNNYIKKETDLDIYVQIGEDFYGMLYRTMRQSPRIIIENDILDDLITISLNYMTTNQIQISKNIMIFFQSFIKFPKSNIYQDMFKENQIIAENCTKIIQNQMDKFGDILCKKILQIFINTSIGQIIENLTELFTIFISCQNSLVIKGMNIYLKDCPNDILTNKEKIQFVNLIENYSVKKEEFNLFFDNFINRCINKQIRNRGQN